MAFTPEQDRTVQADVVRMGWCPRMDLLALVLANGTVEVRRLSWQRLGDPVGIPPGLVSLTWKPDGKAIALGFDDGHIRLLSVERNLIREINNAVSSPVSALAWIESDPDISDVDPLDGCPISIPRCSRVLQCFDPLPSIPSETSVMNPRVTFATAKPERIPDPETLDILLAGSHAGTITLHALGHFPIGRIEVGDALAGAWFTPRSNRRAAVRFAVDGLELSRDLRHLSAVVGLREPRPSQPAVLALGTWRVTTLRSSHQELRAVAAQAAQIEFLLGYVREAMAAGKRIWAAARRLFDMKFQCLEKLSGDHDEQMSVADALVALAISGTLTQALEQFLTTYLGETSAARISKAWLTSCDALVALCDANLKRALEEITFRLGELRALARCPGDAPIGLSVSDLDALVTQATATLMKVDELHRIALETSGNFHHFFAWIMDWAGRMAEETRAETTPLVDRIDIHRVTAFISKDLQRDRISVFFAADRLDEASVVALPEQEIADLTKLWSEHQYVSLHSEIAELAEKWEDFRQTPQTTMSRTFTLVSVVPLAPCATSVPFSLSSRVAIPHHHLLAFLHNDHIYLVRSALSETYEMAAFRLEGRAVQIGFHNDTHLAVLSIHDHSTVLTLVDIVENSTMMKAIVTGRELSGRFAVDAISAPKGILNENRERRWMKAQGQDMAVCGSRGMVSILSGSRRVLVVDMATDEDMTDA